MEHFWIVGVTVVAAVAASTISPLFLDFLANRRERLDSALRQDEMARRAEEHISKLISLMEITSEHAKQAKESLLAYERKLVDAYHVTHNKLDSIHVLVNSTRTAALQGEYDATTREYALMQEVIALRKAAGSEPNQEALDALVVTKERIHQLRLELDKRKEAQDKIDEASGM